MKNKKDSKKSKHKKHKKKEKKSRKHSTSSSSSGSSEDGQAVWVEKAPAKPNVSNTGSDASTIHERQEPAMREEWMNLNTLFPCVSNPSNEQRLKKRGEDSNRAILDKPGQSSKELNPYWKNGGSGLPQTDPTKSSTNQYLDPQWLKKSLRRAQEQADEEGRSLNEVAAERWGSLETIKSMIAQAEKETAVRHGDRYNKWINKAGHKLRKSSVEHSKSNAQYRDTYTESAKRYPENRFDRQESYKNYDRCTTQEKIQKQKFQKPGDSDYDSSSYKTNRASSKAWQKKLTAEKKVNEPQSEVIETKERVTSANIIENEMQKSEATVLSEAELNKLGAKIVKAEIMGDTELVQKLKAELEKARALSATSSDKTPSSKVENVILVRTDSKGVARPLEQGNHSKDFSGTKKRRVETHVSGERVRHYFDDDKYSLQQLFQREKGRSVNEDDAAFTKVVSKRMDMNDLFEEQITHSQSDSKQEARDRATAINEHKRLTKSLDNCRWCIDSKYMLKHLIIAMNSQICLSLPAFVSLTEGHCVLTPVHHISCQLQLDEDIWEQLKTFQKALCKLFADQDQCPIFFEVYKNRHKFPHMQLECVPLPKEIGESAPMYFKKALLECETEWAINKKVIDLKYKDVRSSIPNGLSYFMVQFGVEGGYAHVIEDEHMFPKNFAEEIIGGMLDLDHDLWRRPRKETFEEQRRKVLRFEEIWKKYDFEKRTVND